MTSLQNTKVLRPFIGAVVALTERPDARKALEICTRVRDDYFPDAPVAHTITERLPENLSEESARQLEIYRLVFPGTLYLIVIPGDTVNYRDQHIL